MIPNPTRRAVLTAAIAGGAGLAGAALTLPLGAGDEAADLVKQLTGRTAAESDRLHLSMPRVFPNVRLLAPKNPLIEIGTFHFTPRHGVARVSTRIRLAEPQHVLAVAEMSDGTLMMSRVWVEVESNGCT